jgi:hypothetical protein
MVHEQWSIYTERNKKKKFGKRLHFTLIKTNYILLLHIYQNKIP